MKNILLTGSETFGKYLANPSKWLALTVDGKEIAGYKIHSLILPSVVLVPEGDEDPGIRIVKHALKINAKCHPMFQDSGLRVRQQTGYIMRSIVTKMKIYNL